MESINNPALSLTKVGNEQTKVVNVLRSRGNLIHSDLKRDSQVSIERKKKGIDMSADRAA